MICDFQLKALQHGTLQTNPYWLNTTENFLQLQTVVKEPELSKCWRLNAKEEMVKMQLQSALKLAVRTAYKYNHTCMDWYDT